MPSRFEALQEQTVGNAGDRMEKKRERAAAYRQKHSNSSHTSHACDLTTSNSFYIDILDSTTAVARTNRGSILATLPYDTLDQLYTPEFQDAMIAAVCSGHHTTTAHDDPTLITPSSSPTASSSQELSYVCAMVLQEEEDEAGARAEAEAEDAAVAADLQAVEEDAIMAAVVQSEFDCAWLEVLTRPTPGSRSPVKGGVAWQARETTSRESEWPGLPPPSSPRPVGASFRGRGFGAKQPLVLTARRTTSIDDDLVSPKTLAAIAAAEHDVPLEEAGYRVLQDGELAELSRRFGGMASTSTHAATGADTEGLWGQQYTSTAAATTRRLATEIAEREDTKANSPSKVAGVLREDMKLMMTSREKSSASRPGSGERYVAGRSGAGSQQGSPSKNCGREEGGSEHERLVYSRKSIRKLVGDMFERGWRPLPGRGGGHLMYERMLEDVGKRQMLTLPCTPSDVKSIENAHSKLQKLDREAADLRRAAV